MTSLTSSLAVNIASDKELTNRLLAAAGQRRYQHQQVRVRRSDGRRPDGSRRWALPVSP